MSRGVGEKSECVILRIEW